MTTAARYAPFYRAREGQTTFLNNLEWESAWLNQLCYCKASRIFVYRHVYEHMEDKRVLNDDFRKRLVPCDNPRLCFIQTLQNDPDVADPVCEDISDYNATNIIPASTKILQPTAVAHATFGENCIVYPCVTIGFPAMAIERDSQNRLYNFPHIGRVIIGDNVTIDPQTSISRGSLDDTVIGNNCRIDNQVHIAHNCRIGDNTILTAGATLGGSVTIGHDCWLGLNCTIMNSLKIGNHVIVGQGANVIHDITEDYDIVAGNPAKSIKSNCKASKEKLYMMRGEQEQERQQENEN